MKKILGLIFLTILFGCSITKHLTEKKPDCIIKNFKTQFTDKDSSGVPYYQSEEFANTALKDYSIKSIKDRYRGNLKISLIPIVNRYDTKIVDTIYRFSNHNNLIEVYRAKQADFVIQFDISDAVFKLNGCISAGSDKNSIAKQFGIKESIGDIITIGSQEKTVTFTLYFKNNKVVRIRCYIYFE